MDKTKLIPALIISIAILVLLIITTVVTNINKGNKQIHPKANHTLRHWKARM